MGSYRVQYENYYRGLNSRGSYSGYGRKTTGNNVRIIPVLNKEYFIKRLTRELIGVFILFIFVLICRYVNTPQTKAAYSYSKTIVNKNFDYKNFYSLVASVNLSTVKEKINELSIYFNKQLNGGEGLKDSIALNYIIPAQGAIITHYGDVKDTISGSNKFYPGIDISLPEGSDIKSCSDGKIKTCKSDSELGNYIVIDHGNGLETKYANLKEFVLKEGDSVSKGQVIAKSGNTGKSTAPHLHFELLYMGENLNPEEYMAFPRGA